MQSKEDGAKGMTNDKDKLVAYWTKENIVQRQKGYFDYATRKMFDKFLTNLAGKKILDVGCGTGLSMEYFRGRGADVRGIDITYSSIEYVNDMGLPALQADARRLPYKDNSFDIVYSIGVIEHFNETEDALKEQSRVCKPGGIVIAVVPNLWTPYSAATILFEFLSGRARHGIITTYGRPFGKKRFTEMFKRAGCRDVDVEPYYGSAILRFFFKKVHRRLTDLLERSVLSKAGLVLWGWGRKS